MKRQFRYGVFVIKSAIAVILGLPKAKREFAVETPIDEKFRFAVEACPNAMLLTDSTGRIILANTEAERMFCSDQGELIGKPMKILVPEHLHAKYLENRASVARHQTPRRFGASSNLLGRRLDGTEFPIEVRLNPVQTRGGLLVLSVVVDISERVRTDRLKDEFVSTVSHELRTPLTSIAGSLGLLIGGAAGKLPEQALRLIGIAQTNSQRLVRLINDILDIEKIESGQVVFNFRRIETRALVGQVIDANRGYADGFGVRMRLKSGSDSAEVYADTDRLAQVITNLLSNAIKFSQRGGEVLVAIKKCGDAVRISVRDHGPGIPAEFRPRIFEKFAQADASDTRQKGGTGLGLSIVKQIVARLGGQVGFEDAVGGGTVFYVDLPDWQLIANRAIDVDRDTYDIRILLCEDDPDTAVALREGLRPVGFSTDFAHSPSEAITRARQASYAAIVVDLELPGGDGVGLVRWLREQPKAYRTPIVVMSKDRTWEKNGSASSLNVRDLIEKPVNIDHLAQILDGAVAREPNGRPHILHVDDDGDVLDLVAEILRPTASVTSVASVEEARRALLMNQFDLAVLDMNVGSASGLELLSALRRKDGAPVPVIIFSAYAANIDANPQVEANLNKSAASLDNLVAAVHDRLMLRSAKVQENVQ
jgi:PAS domain S-box-containing protein